MKKFIMVLGFMSLVAAPVFAQLYNDKHDLVVAPMDQAAQESAETYANVAIAGAAEDVKGQEERYEGMTEPMDEANESHFDFTANTEKVSDKEKK